MVAKTAGESEEKIAETVFSGDSEACCRAFLGNATFVDVGG